MSDRADRLVDFMGDGGRQLPHGRDPIGVGKLHLCVEVPPFGLSQGHLSLVERSDQIVKLVSGPRWMPLEPKRRLRTAKIVSPERTLLSR